jgi:hypothetical protein
MDSKSSSAACLLLFLLVACGDDESGSPSSSSDATSSSATSSVASTSAQSSGGDGGTQSTGGGGSSGDGGGGAGGQGDGGDASGAGGAGGSGAGGDDVEVTEMTVRTRVGDSEANVPFLAYQDGDGPWQAVDGLGGRYDLLLTGDRFGVAWVCEFTAYGRVFPAVAVVFATAADGFPGTLYCGADEWVEVEGTIDGLAPSEFASVYFRRSSATVDEVLPEVMNVQAPDVIQDVVVVRYVDSEVEDLQIRRAYQPGAGFFVSFDDGGIDPEQVEPEGPGTYSSRLHTARGTTASIGRTNTSLWRLPESALEDGDLHVFSKSGPEGSHSYFSRAGEAVDLPLPAAAIATQVEVVESGPHARFSIEVDYDDAPEDHVLAYRFRASQSDEEDGMSRRWAVYASEAWLDGASTFETPGFGDLEGWNEQWSLEEGISAEIYTEAYTSSAGLGPLVRSAGDGVDLYLADEDEGAHTTRIAGGEANIVP